jgi:thymidylate synthase (FAD)
MILVKPSFEITDYNGGSVPRIAQAARTCYKSEYNPYVFADEQDDILVRKLIASGHHSTLEHEKATVKIICDRGVSHELVRHRIASFSQESTRYCNYSKDKFGNQLTFVIPPWVKFEARELSCEDFDFLLMDEKFLETPDCAWLRAMYESEQTYLELLNYNWQPQQARSVLPNSLKTEIIITANLREWRHIFKLRAEGSAGKPHPQMLEIMIPLLKEFKTLIPIIFDDIKEMEV